MASADFKTTISRPRKLGHNAIGPSSAVAKGGEGGGPPWRHFYGGGTMGYGAVGYKPAKAVLK